MAFVKLDCGMLDSTLWLDREARELFITALLMAIPFELLEPAKQLKVRSLEEAGFVVPPGWYGLIEAAGPGIVYRAGMETEAGMAALERLGEPEEESRTPDFGGRRLVRIAGGYIALNFQKYREKDHTAAERSKRYRQKMGAKRKPGRPKKSGPVSATYLGPVSATYLGLEAKGVEAANNGDEKTFNETVEQRIHQ
jgi:hypothetical protein